MIQSLLVANRGEIACRIIRTARGMGIRTVAVYSDADARALHVRQADAAIHIGPAPAHDSYLCGDKIIAAAKEAGSEAVHPGYGFLSENAEFAQGVIDAGLIWVGPSPASIIAMGRKDAAKRLMQAAGVPVTPGYMGEDQSLATLAGEAGKIGYPVLIKAVAGGGGKGMRRVDRARDFAEALASCLREAAASFGNADVLLEKYIERPRHIEVQVFGDSHGNIVHLFERDCSLQRRHQKVIEEAPAPGMDNATRECLCNMAVQAARAVNYTGAGTIEFIADAHEGLRADRIWFMEMNTRLQVEHPVTEAITGVDLVAWQLRVASGEALPLRQEELAINGHAIEARLYAEDPAKGFLPSVGRLDFLVLPDEARVESGVEARDVVSPYYDPMIAKIISSGKSRDNAISTLAQACRGVRCAPVKTNAWFLARLLEEPDFRAGHVSTGFIEANLGRLIAPPRPSKDLLEYAADDFATALVPDGLDNPMYQFHQIRFGFRLNAAQDRRVRLRVNGKLVVVEPSDHTLCHNSFGQAVIDGTTRIYFEGGAAHVIGLDRTDGSSAGTTGTGTILSPMPGKVIAIEVSAGARVTQGQRLLTLEAMKMEHSLTAPFDGIVAELVATPGQQVQVEAVLARIEADSTKPEEAP